MITLGPLLDLLGGVTARKAEPMTAAQVAIARTTDRLLRSARSPADHEANKVGVLMPPAFAVVDLTA